VGGSEILKILFLNADIFISEPLGVMTLSAICKRLHHETKLIALKKHSLIKTLNDFKPDLIAYSAMSADIDLFRRADESVIQWCSDRGKRITRIMGGPHATFFPEILEEMQLDAICVGEGDHAILSILHRIEKGEEIKDVPNVLGRGENIEDMKKELIQDLNKLPFADRQIYYEAVPSFRMVRMRSVLSSRGCPYNCTYCHNHVFKKMFKGCGEIIRRASVDHVMDELKFVIKHFPPVRLIRFGDDTFAHSIDDWLVELLTRYKKEINIPFYCLMRSNVLTEEMAELLASHGCVSIGMAVESGNERIRNKILGRNLSDEVVINSFHYANKYGLKTFGNTMLAIPGGNFKEDLESFFFTKRLKLTAPTFGIVVPYPRTALSDFALQSGFLEKDYKFDKYYSDKSAFNHFTDKEKEMQLNIVYLGTLFCALPDFFIPFFRILIKFKPNFIFKFIGMAYLIYKSGRYVFQKVIPLDPLSLIKFFNASIDFIIPKKDRLYPKSGRCPLSRQPFSTLAGEDVKKIRGV